MNLKGLIRSGKACLGSNEVGRSRHELIMTATTQASDGTSVTPRSGWRAILCETTAEVFLTMVGAPVSTVEDNNLPVLAQVTAMVGIAGAARAIFSLRCSTRSATMIASQMLGVPVEEAAAQQCDAVGEICSIVAGYFKAKIGLGEKCMLSVPTVLIGNDYQVRAPVRDHSLEFPVLYDGEPIWIALDVRE